MRIAITGHQKLGNAQTVSWLRRTLASLLELKQRPLIGVTSLAAGADQAFADAVLALGGGLEVVVPFPDYENRFVNPADRTHYGELLRAAQWTEVLEPGLSDEEAYMRAGKAVVDRADEVIAIWNGRPAVGLGGTADVVAYALKVGRPVQHLDPETQTVTSLQSGQDHEG